MDYGKILKEGWRITWETKFLWLLGFLAALGGNTISGNGSGGGNTNFGNFGGSGSPSGGGSSDFETFIEDFFNTGTIPSGFEETIGAVIGIFAAIFICFFCFFLIMYFVRFIAESGLIQAAFDIANGQPSNFSQAFSAGRPFMIPMFGMRLILAIPTLVVITIGLIGGAVTAAQSIASFENNPEAIFGAFGFFGIVMGCFLCLIIPYSIFVSLIYPLAQRGMVLRGMRAMDSIRHGWETLKNNIGEMLLLGVIYVALGIAVGIVSAIILIPIVLAFAAPMFLTLANNNFDFTAVGAGQYGLIGIGFFVIILVSSAINAVAVTFRSSSFTLAYIEFMNKSKLQAKGQ